MTSDSRLRVGLIFFALFSSGILRHNETVYEFAFAYIIILCHLDQLLVLLPFEIDTNRFSIRHVLAVFVFHVILSSACLSVPTEDGKQSMRYDLGEYCPDRILNNHRRADTKVNPEWTLLDIALQTEDLGIGNRTFATIRDSNNMVKISVFSASATLATSLLFFPDPRQVRTCQTRRFSITPRAHVGGVGYHIQATLRAGRLASIQAVVSDSVFAPTDSAPIVFSFIGK